MSHQRPQEAGVQQTGQSVDAEERRRFLVHQANAGSAAAIMRPADAASVQQQVRCSPAAVKMAQINGIVNRLSVEDLQRNLRLFGIEDQGSADSCRIRLKNHMRQEAMAKVTGQCFQQQQQRFFYDAICVIDFEATCEQHESQPFPPPASSSPSPSSPAAHSVPQEIIEFPAFLVDVQKKQVISTFHMFVKPIRSEISEFCTSLTGITAEMIRQANPFPVVMDRFEEWLYSNLKNHSYRSFAMASDGSWDFAHFFAVTCHLNSMPYPAYAKRWINVRKVFSSHYKCPSSTLSRMLSHLGLVFEGRKHSGLDDARNIARLLIRMLVDGANPVINERISWHSSERNSCPE